MKTPEQIIAIVKDNKENYLNHCAHAKAKLISQINEMTTSQIQQEMIYIADMESRAYAMFLLLEELEAE